MLDLVDNTRLKFMFLTEEKIEESAELLAEAFLSMNKIWIALGVKKEDALKIMRARIRKAYPSSLSVMMVTPQTEEVAMMGIAIDLVDYMKKDETPAVILGDWQLKIKKVAQELEEEYFLSLNPKRGEYLYGDSAGANKKIVSKSGAVEFWGTGFTIYKSLGYKHFLARSSNPITTLILQKFGAKPVRRAYLEGTQEYMQIIYMDLENLKIPSLTSLHPEKPNK